MSPDAPRPKAPPDAPPDDAPSAALDVRALYVAHFAFVWRVLRQLGVPRAGLDDAVQNVFLVAHRRAAEFEGRAQPRTWLFRIAQRVASDARRQARRKGGLDALPETVRDPAAGPQESAEQREALAVLDAVLDQLDEEKRAVFVLAELEGMTGPEIAEALGVKVNTVGSRLRAARQQFEQAVARYQRRNR